MPDTLLKKESPFDKLRINIIGLDIFSYGSAALFLLVIASYGVVVLLNHNLKAKEPQLEEEIRQDESDLKGDLHDLIAVDSRLNELGRIVSKHRFSGGVFEFFEKNALPQVQFSNFVLSGNNYRADLAGETANFRTLAQQITVLERQPEVQNVEFGGIAINSKNRINFTLKITFSPSVFTRPPQPTP